MKNTEDVDRLITENLKISRSLIFLKREVILLRAEREDRATKMNNVLRYIEDNNSKVNSLQKSYDNIKEIQNHISYENNYLKSKIEYLEEIILSYGK